MEHRDDWERILLDGLPADEREQVIRRIAQSTDDKLRHIRAQNAIERQREDARRQQAGDDVDGHEDRGDLLEA